jgi:hypothetical protein
MREVRNRATGIFAETLFCEGRSRSSGRLVAEDCCAKRTMSPRSPLVDTFLGTPFCCEWQPLLPKGVPRKVSTSELRGDIVRFAQQEEQINELK